MPDLLPFPNALLLLGLLAWTGVLVRRWVKDQNGQAGIFLGISLLLVFAARGAFMVGVEPNPDTSTWLAATLTVAHRSDPLWTLLNFTDARPLTVLPLVVAQALGATPGYAVAETVGVLCWLGTLALVYRILRFQHPPATSLLGCWALAVFVGTVGYNDYIAYNSEHFAVLLLTLGTVGVLSLERRPVVPAWLAGALGLLLGSLPYEKFQTVPMGLVLAGFALTGLLRRRAWGAAGALVAGGLLFTALVTGYFASRGEVETFWTTYFWHYFYYAYSQEFSPLPPAQRFSPARVMRYVFSNRHSVGYLAGMAGVGVAGLFLGAKRRVFRENDFARKNLILSFLLLLTSLYAVLQAGNNFTHYTWLLFVPLLHVASAVVALAQGRVQRVLLLVGLGTALAQGLVNAWNRRPLPPSSTDPADRRLVAVIQTHSRPGEPIVVWGWADRFHLLADRPMGYRYANTFFVYAAYRAVASADLGYFLHDLEKNRPVLFVDAMTPEFSLVGQTRYQHEYFPAVAAYVRQHYRRVGGVNGARVYRRIGPQ